MLLRIRGFAIQVDPEKVMLPSVSLRRGAVEPASRCPKPLNPKPLNP